MKKPIKHIIGLKNKNDLLKDNQLNICLKKIPKNDYFINEKRKISNNMKKQYENKNQNSFLFTYNCQNESFPI